jgi:hypothetical protein
MAIDATDELIPLRNVPSLRWLPPRRGGAKLHPVTLYKWAKHGLRGHKLETIRVGGVPCTSEGALRAFFEKLATPVVVLPDRTAKQRRKAVDRANKTLDDAGITLTRK